MERIALRFKEQAHLALLCRSVQTFLAQAIPLMWYSLAHRLGIDFTRSKSGLGVGRVKIS
jgi:hypothetical protein